MGLSILGGFYGEQVLMVQFLGGRSLVSRSSSLAHKHNVTAVAPSLVMAQVAVFTVLMILDLDFAKTYLHSLFWA
jgi:hypothetical protein